MGSDFPAPVLDQINTWQTSCTFRSNNSRLVTRGWNGYDSNENRAFKYTTPKIRLEPDSLTVPLLMASSFHMVCSPSRCQSLVSSLLTARKKIDRQAPKPIIVWEPVPDRCTPDELINLTHALRDVTICSPNHLELGNLLGSSGVLPSGSVDKEFVEQACEQLLESMPISSYGIIVRSGKDGCYVCKPPTTIRTSKSSKPASGATKKKPRSTPSNTHGTDLSMTAPSSIDFEALFAGKNWERSFGNDDDDDDGNGSSSKAEPEPKSRVIDGVEKWIPAYYTPETSAKVVDPTGGGNAFLGAVAVALARGEEFEEAALWGSVAASFVIEQTGMPNLDGVGANIDGEGDIEMSGVGMDGAGDESGKGDNEVEEKWNGASVKQRLTELRERVKTMGNWKPA